MPSAVAAYTMDMQPIWGGSPFKYCIQSCSKCQHMELYKWRGMQAFKPRAGAVNPWPLGLAAHAWQLVSTASHQQALACRTTLHFQ